MPRKSVEITGGWMKADMHCHTYFSGKTGHMTAFEPMDSYTTPQQLYDLAKKRGMDLVTITDHDSIDGCLSFLEKNPDAEDFFIGEEVTVQVPEFRKAVHIAVYDITESQHREISYLKRNFDDTVAYLKEQQILHALNHLFHDFPESIFGKQFIARMLDSFQLMEGLNGALHEGHNKIMQRLAHDFPGKGLIAGSDSHTTLRLGSCFTAARARNKKEFLQEIRNSRTVIAGTYGHFHHLFNDAMGVYINYFRDLVFRRNVHIHWPFWKEVRNAAGWIICLPVFFAGALGGIFVQTCIEKYRQGQYESFIDELKTQNRWTPIGSPEFI